MGIKPTPKVSKQAVLAGDLGARCLIQKPFTREEIAGVIRTVLENETKTPAQEH